MNHCILESTRVTHIEMRREVEDNRDIDVKPKQILSITNGI